jgi:coenzyme F420 hydrogenase subunit beta
MNIPKVISVVVQNDLCIGCGICVPVCPSKVLEMDWNENGFLIPNLSGDCDSSGECLKVCPFNPFPTDEVSTENELAKLFLREAPNFHQKVGKYYNTYVGYSEKYRLTSSSGGLATYILTELFDRKLIDAVITVGEGENNFFAYKMIKGKEDLLASSKTKYYPVTMADALKELENFEGKVAVVGIGCFIKAARLLQHHDPLFKKKIVFTIGIICGGLKSKFFGEYLAAKTGIEDNKFFKPQFRIKDYQSTAGDYSFGCVDKRGNDRQVKMRTVGDMWGTGMFKCNACDFCDDVTTELADISLGDAWLPPYHQEGKGTSVLVTRTALAEVLIAEGILSKKLNVQELAFERFLASQQGSYNHRHTGMSVRIKHAKKKNQLVPPKRFGGETVPLDFKIVQIVRMIVRKKSLEIWAKNKTMSTFDTKIEKYLKLLNFATRIYHYTRKIMKRN